MAELRIPIVVENKGKKAFKDVDKSVKNLSGSFKKLAGAAGLALSAAAVVKFGKAAAKAFIEDEKAASRLAMSVKNLGLEFETPRIEKFIEEISRASGVTDDQLRPAMQRLLQTTGSVAKSQELLTQALDISAGSGVDYETVVNDLSAAYLGQTKGLTKYSLGLTKAELKTMKFSDIQEKLNKQFTGANSAYLETYAGKMGILSNAAGEASETIGKGLIDALMILSGDTTVEDLAITMETLASNTSNAITQIAKLGKNVANFFSESYGKADSLADRITDFLDRLTGNEERITRRNVGQARRFFGGSSGGAGGDIETPEQKAQRLKREAAEKAAAKRAKELAALQAKSLVDAAKKARLESAARKLDLQRINIAAALKGKVSETDKLSLELQLALLNQNDTEAKKLSDQLDAAIKRQKELEAALLATPKAPNPFSDWTIPKLDFGGNLLGSQVPNFVPPSWSIPKLDFGGNLLGSQVPNFVPPSYMTPDFMAGITSGTVPKAYEPPPISITVELDGQAVGGAIRDTQINDSLAGSFSQTNRFAAKGAIAI